MMVRVLLFACFLVCAPANAQELQPFVRGSLTNVVATRAGAPFVLGFWSISCAHCQEELSLLGEMLKANPRLPLVLVSTDTPSEHEAITTILARHGLTNVENWVFADDYVERLRFEVDPRWYGELPRIYFYRDGRPVHAVSGRVDRKTLETWLAKERS